MCTWKLKVSRVLKRAIPERIIFVFHRLRIDERIILQDSQTNSCFWIFLNLMSYWETTFLQKLASSWEQVPGTFLSYCTHAYNRDSRLLCWNFMFCVLYKSYGLCNVLGLSRCHICTLPKQKAQCHFSALGQDLFVRKLSTRPNFVGFSFSTILIIYSASCWWYWPWLRMFWLGLMMLRFDEGECLIGKLRTKFPNWKWDCWCN